MRQEIIKDENYHYEKYSGHRGVIAGKTRPEGQHHSTGRTSDIEKYFQDIGKRRGGTNGNQKESGVFFATNNFDENCD